MNYRTIEEAEEYFATRLHTDAWDDAEEEDRTKALTMATKIIDMFNYKGEKTSDAQENEFPRGGDTDIPSEILEACCEIALKLLDEIDPDIEIDNLNKVSSAFASVKSNYDKSFIPEHLTVGVPSATAWRQMAPYLRDAKSVTVSRVQP
jgi:Fe-S cluster assembly ATPase SufC